MATKNLGRSNYILRRLFVLKSCVDRHIRQKRYVAIEINEFTKGILTARTSKRFVLNSMTSIWRRAFSICVALVVVPVAGK